MSVDAAYHPFSCRFYSLMLMKKAQPATPQKQKNKAQTKNPTNQQNQPNKTPQIKKTQKERVKHFINLSPFSSQETGRGHWVLAFETWVAIWWGIVEKNENKCVSCLCSILSGFGFPVSFLCFLKGCYPVCPAFVISCGSFFCFWPFLLGVSSHNRTNSGFSKWSRCRFVARNDYKRKHQLPRKHH